MLTGPFINAAAVLIGGSLGALLSHRLPERVRSSMPSIFGLASLGIGVLLVIKCVNLPVMVLATLVGTLIGELCYVERGISGGVNALRNWCKSAKAAKPIAPMNRLSRVWWPSLFCSAPAVPGFLVQCAKG